MSRHRDVRNLENSSEYHDDGDYGSSYGSSYGDDISLSRSLEEQYMYKRNASGTTPRMGHFLSETVTGDEEPDSDDDSFISSPGRRHSSSSLMLDELSDDDQKRLAACLETILDVVGEAKSEVHIKETIVKCDFDANLALNTILNNPSSAVSFGGPSTRSENIPIAERDSRRLRPNPTPWSPPAAPVMPAIPASAIMPEAGGVSEIFLPSSLENSSKPKPVPKGPLATIKKANRLDIRSRSPSPNVSSAATLISSPSSSNLSSAVKMRRGKIDAVKVYEEERGSSKATTKELLNLVVVGHVDSGKSTLMGHVLVDLGQVSSRVMHKYENESKKIGKSSFAYAWVLDETSEERERGITMDVGHSSFETATKTITLLDAPGHRDFIPNMISGAYQADVAVLVVNATRGEFEAGFDAGGQTREHALLVRSLGVLQLIVAVNKLDTVDWSKKRFSDIVEKLGKFLRSQVGFKEQDVSFIPVSGLTGANLVKKDCLEQKPETEWIFESPTLIEAIDRLKSPKRAIEKSFRMSVSDVFKPTTSSGGFCLGGRIETGYVQKNDTALISPLNEVINIKSVNLDNVSGVGNASCAFAGDHVSLTVTGVDQQNVCQGMIVCDPQYPVKVSRHFAAKIVVLNIDIPITKGCSCVLHHAGVTESATLKKLVAQINKGTGEIIKKKPRVITKNSSAIVEVVTENTICLETFSESKELGRFMLRVGGKTIAAGMVTEIY